MKEMTFHVKGMHCSSCEALVQDAVSDIDGVSKVVASRKKGTVLVTLDEHKTAAEVVRRAIEGEGYTVQ